MCANIILRHEPLLLINAFCQDDRWFHLSEMPGRRCRCGVAVVRGRVYAVGGFNGSLRVRTVDMYDPTADSWSSIASMEARRSTLGVAVLNDHIYAVGGFDGSSGLNTAEVTTNQRTVLFVLTNQRVVYLHIDHIFTNARCWTLVWVAVRSGDPSPAWAPGGAAWGWGCWGGWSTLWVGMMVTADSVWPVWRSTTQIKVRTTLPTAHPAISQYQFYFHKGFTLSPDTNIFIRYLVSSIRHVSTEEWSRGGSAAWSPLQCGWSRWSPGEEECGVLQQRQQQVDSCSWHELLSQVTHDTQWNNFQSQWWNIFRNAGVISHNGVLYVIGGDDGTSNLASVEMYNPKTDSWTVLAANMTIGRSYTGVSVIDKPSFLWVMRMSKISEHENNMWYTRINVSGAFKINICK